MQSHMHNDGASEQRHDDELRERLNFVNDEANSTKR
jgi:hypothetical protein